MLANLKIVDVVKSGPNSDATARMRQRTISAIQEQKASVEAAIKKEPFKVTRRVAGGEQRERRFKPWWWRGAGFYYTTCNYGSSPIQLPGGGKAIEAGHTMELLLKTYDALAAAVEAGELDQVLLAAAAKRGRKNKGGEAAVKPVAGAGMSGSARGKKGA